MRMAAGMKRWWVAALAGVAVLVTAGCSSSSGSASGANDSAATGVAPVAAGAPTRAAGDGGGETEAQNGAPAGTSAADPGAGLGQDPGTAPTDRQVVRTASLTLRIEVASTGKGDQADDKAVSAAMDAAAAQARAVVGSQGYVGGSEGHGNTLTLTLRVPSTGYQQAMDRLAGLGTVTDRQEQAEDVTATMVDLDSRIETMKASVARVRALLAKAEKVGDVVSIESELSQREADLESLQRRQAALSGQASLSTITVTMLGSITGTATTAAEPDERTGFLGGLARGWDAFLSFGSGLLTFLGTILPFLPVLAVVAIIVWWLVRRSRARTAAALGLTTGTAGASAGSE